MNKVLVGISGGVDSSVAAYLLLQQGYEVHGIFMQNWEEDGHCTSEDDYIDAKKASSKLNIPLKYINLAKDYKNKVFDKLLNGLSMGVTPNPDVLCNKEIKFKLLLNYAKDNNYKFLATGHYAGIKEYNNKFYLTKAKDDNKDQTYFLFNIDYQALSYIHFPLSNLLKTEVRQIAKSISLPNCDRKDSTGICFIGKRPFKDFIKTFILPKKGNIKDAYGNILGQHEGVYYYTIGQRSGLGIGGRKNIDTSPWYVVKKDLATNELIVAQNESHDLIFSKELICNHINLLVEKELLPRYCMARIRHRQKLQKCSLTEIKEGYKVGFEEEQRSITPGQSIVFYKDNICLGGAEIITPQSHQ